MDWLASQQSILVCNVIFDVIRKRFMTNTLCFFNVAACFLLTL